MKVLLDQNIPIGVEQLLQQHGWDAVHTRTLGMARATGEDVLAYALTNDLVVVSADRDFGDLLPWGPAAESNRRPSHYE